jgi:hypothetical protein
LAFIAFKNRFMDGGRVGIDNINAVPGVPVYVVLYPLIKIREFAAANNDGL